MRRHNLQLLMTISFYCFSVFLISSCSHHETWQLSENSRPVEFKLEQTTVSVTPFRKIAFDQDHDVLVFKFDSSDESKKLQPIAAESVLLKSQQGDMPLLSDDQLRQLSALEESYLGNIHIGQPLGNNYSYTKLYQIYSNQRLIKLDGEVRIPANQSENTLYEFFLVPKNFSHKEVELQLGQATLVHIAL